MEGVTETLADLFEAAVKEEKKEPEMDLCLEIADRMNSSKIECKEGVKELIKVLRSSKSAYVHNGVLVLESLVKNCNMRFHYEVASKEFMETLLKLLKRKRGKTGYFDTMYKNATLWDEIEHKVLYLIQLWADTFMMHEDEFRDIMETYRLLRKEGIKFPPREKNEKFMIQFEGTASPIFEYLENMPEVIKNQQPQTTFTKKGTVANNQIQRPKGKPYAQQKDDDDFGSSQKEKKKKKTKSKKDSDEEEDDNNDDNVRELTINEQEIGMIMGALSVLEEIRENAENYQELKNEVALEIINDCKMCYKRLSKMTKVQRLNGRDLAKALELQDSILEGLGLYKSKAEYLKNINFYKKDGEKKVMSEGMTKSERLNTEPMQQKETPIRKKGGKVVRSKSPSEKRTGQKEQERKEIIDLLNEGDDLFGGHPTPKGGEGEEVGKKEDMTKTLQDIFSKDFYQNLMATKNNEKGKSPFHGFEVANKDTVTPGGWGNTNPFAVQPQVSTAQLYGGQPQPVVFPGVQIPMQGQPLPFAIGYPQIAGMPRMVGAPMPVYGVGQTPFVGINPQQMVPFPQPMGFAPATPIATEAAAPQKIIAPAKTAAKEEANDDDFFDDLANRNVKVSAEH